jgi:hypothetical protein
MLPLKNTAQFVDRICTLDPEVLVLQGFHDSRGGFGADTGARARAILLGFPAMHEQYHHCLEMLRTRRPVFEGEAGFFPPS